MNPFEDRLIRRLERLERSVPASLYPHVAGSGTTASISRLRRQSNRQRVALLVIAPVALLAAVTVATAERTPNAEAPDAALEAVLTDIFARGDCIPAASARSAIETRLKAIGRTGWIILERPGAGFARCVGAVPFPEDQMIMLYPAPGEKVLKALEAAARHLLTYCLDEDAARTYVSAVLAVADRSDVSVRVDPSIRTVPADVVDEYERHVAAGCFVYAGYQHDSEGNPYAVLWGH